jgi:hypothetical protein
MKTLTITLIFLMVGIIIIWLIAEWGKRIVAQVHTYDRIYASIQVDLQCDTINRANYLTTKKRLEWLADLPYKDKERTHVLYLEFERKYAEINQDEEHSPESIFTDE